MKRILIVVDMQTDFVDGALGTPEALAILGNVTAKISAYAADPAGVILVTYDTHTEDYMHTAEGKHLPVPHCIKGTAGWELHPAVAAALEGVTYTSVEKPTFGSVALPALVAQAAAGEDFALEPMELPGVFPGNETGMLTLVPGEYETDGFFIARLRRKA